MQEEHEAPAAKRVCRSGSVSITLADSDVLDCPICFGPFRPPVLSGLFVSFVLFCFLQFSVGFRLLFANGFFFLNQWKKSECLHSVVSGANRKFVY